MRVTEFEEKPMVANSRTISTGIYIVRRRLLIDLIEHCAEEDRYDFVTDILIRYKNLKKIYGYKIKDYWSNISTVDAYYRTNTPPPTPPPNQPPKPQPPNPPPTPPPNMDFTLR